MAVEVAAAQHAISDENLPKFVSSHKRGINDSMVMN
jgi:hypothetical protein